MKVIRTDQGGYSLEDGTPLVPGELVLVCVDHQVTDGMLCRGPLEAPDTGLYFRKSLSIFCCEIVNGDDLSLLDQEEGYDDTGEETAQPDSDQECIY